MSDRRPDIEAEITLVPTESGGRRTPVLTGYRPAHDFGVEGTLVDAAHDYAAGELIPGETGRALMTFGVPSLVAGHIVEGMTFTVQEGSRIIGRGRVLRVLNESLHRAV